MLKLECIEKFRDKQGNIIGYRLQDNSGGIRCVNAEALKRTILSQKVDVVNLQLTSDNRLITL